MTIHTISNDLVSVGVTEECGHLHPVLFNLDGKVVEPLNVAPWKDEPLDDTIPPMLKMLRGDFFCAPFGSNDILADENRAHGSSANDEWKLINKTENTLELHLGKKISGSGLTKKIKVVPGHSVIYQEHIFSGGEGKIPIGHHLMLKAPEKLHLSFSDFLFGETPPEPVENNPKEGNSILLYPQRFHDLKKVKLKDGTAADFARYPSFDNHEDLLMLKSDEKLTFAWSAAAAPLNGWLWFSIKNPKVLNSTVLWMSNGGRKYPPFSSRHLNVIGIEEVTSYFHLGHKASIEENHLNQKGYSTYLELNPDKPLTVKYAFGLVSIPSGFTSVKSISPENGGLVIEDISGIKLNVNFDLNFIVNK